MDVQWAREHVPVMTKKLTRKPFDPIARDGVAHFAADCDSDTTVLLFSGCEECDKIAIAHPRGVRRQMNEFRSCKQSVVLAKSVPDCWRCVFQSAAYRILLSSGPCSAIHVILYGQPFATFRAASVDDKSSGFR